MLFVKFEANLHSGLNLVKYRHVHDDCWYYLYLDMETIHLLVTNLGIVSTYRIPTQFTNCDNPTTGKRIQVRYCGAAIQLCCGRNDDSSFYLPWIEQNY